MRRRDEVKLDKGDQSADKKGPMQSVSPDSRPAMFRYSYLGRPIVRRPSIEDAVVGACNASSLLACAKETTSYIGYFAED